MAAYEKRGRGWRVKVRRRGYPAQAATFDTRRQAEDWAKQVEGDMARGRFVDMREAERTTVLEAIERYEREISPSLRGRVQDASILRRFKELPLAARSLALVRSADIAAYSASLAAAGCAGNTIRLHLGMFSRVFEACRVLRRMRRRPPLVRSFWQQADLPL